MLVDFIDFSCVLTAGSTVSVLFRTFAAEVLPRVESKRCIAQQWKCYKRCWRQSLERL